MSSDRLRDWEEQNRRRSGGNGASRGGNSRQGPTGGGNSEDLTDNELRKILEILEKSSGDAWQVPLFQVRASLFVQELEDATLQVFRAFLALEDAEISFFDDFGTRFTAGHTDPKHPMTKLDQAKWQLVSAVDAIADAVNRRRRDFLEEAGR